MKDPLQDVFQNYQKNYERRGADTYFRPIDEVLELHLGRLPPWLDRIPKHAHILDAGCATGYLLSLLHGLGYEVLTGVDISREMTLTARQRLPEDVVIHCADIRDFLATTPDGRYDLILCHHVIEHLPREEIIGLLREFRRCMVPGGWLSIKTPNAAALLAGYHVYGDITHITPFNEFSLKQIAEQAGFSAEAVEIVSNPPHLFWSWRHPLRAVLRLLNRLRWHVNRGVHWVVAMLMDVHPAPACREWELEVLIRK